MRFVEIKDGLDTFISNEEAVLSEYIEKNGRVQQRRLKEREVVVANRLVSKNVLKRQRIGEDIYFVRNQIEQGIIPTISAD